MEMTQDLADLITDRFRSADLGWSIGSIRSYKALLADGMEETCESHVNSTYFTVCCKHYRLFF